MARFSTGVVAKVLDSSEGIERVTVKLGRRNRQATSFPVMTGKLTVGDRVVINTTAVELALGTGGDDFVLWNLGLDKVESRSPGHIMKLRYTPWQMDTLVAEAPESEHHELLAEADSLAGMPVVACGLHSQVAPAVAMLKHMDPDLTIAYIMTDGGALPIAHSRVVAELKNRDLIQATITCGHAFGGDLESINIFSSLMAASEVLKADVTVVSVGPGVVGTNTLLGHTGMEQGQVVSAAAALGGRPIAALRISFADQRPRHHGVSRHCLAALRFGAVARGTIAVPDFELDKLNQVMAALAGQGLSDMHDIRIVDAWETEPALKEFDLTPETMGRSVVDDPEFFMAAGAAGLVAGKLIYEID
ncbi:MAG: DUF3866 family protein [Actinomycetota bacterium]